MFIGSLATLLLASSALAGPLVARQNATAPITSANGTTNATSPANGNITASVVQLPVTSNLSIPVVGYTNKAYNVSSYLGIPFASAERFRKPQLVNYAGNATYARGLNATKNGLACMQSYVSRFASLEPRPRTHSLLAMIVPAWGGPWRTAHTLKAESEKTV